MKEYIENTILRICSGGIGNTSYRRPLVTCARADDPLFAELKKAVGPEHLLPQDLLPGAASVVVFFSPLPRSWLLSIAKALMSPGTGLRLTMKPTS